LSRNHPSNVSRMILCFAGQSKLKTKILKSLGADRKPKRRQVSMYMPPSHCIPVSWVDWEKVQCSLYIYFCQQCSLVKLDNSSLMVIYLSEHKGLGIPSFTLTLRMGQVNKPPFACLAFGHYFKMADVNSWDSLWWERACNPT